MNSLPHKMNRVRHTSFVVGILFLILSGIGVAVQPNAFYVSYLIAFTFWFGLAIGCLIITMIHHLAGGDWGNVTRRFFEAGSMTLPLMAVLMIPLLFGLHELYPWANLELVAADKILQQKAAYENITGFTLRALLFFCILTGIAFTLRKWSLQQDAAQDIIPSVKLGTLSGPGIVIVPFVVTFAYVDWIMSIEPAWFSTVFAIILMAGEILTGFSMAVILLACLRTSPVFSETITNKHFHDLGNFLLTFVMFWTYVSFSQFLIIYSGNQPHEISWYMHRLAGSWRWVAVFLLLFHFFAPFFVLLFRSAKQNTHVLAIIAGLLLTVHALAVYWMIAPTFYPAGVAFHWTDFTVWLGMGGLWLGIFLSNLARHPLMISPGLVQIKATALAHEK
ncbi:MAG TPA: hypothetical protein VG347_11820 [Verrucomicrobiae bacterium]|nr:hypothetical protein [Verrucomicrobiae bacterium]